MKCPNCYHKVVSPPPAYVGKERYFHARGGQTAPYCLIKDCKCEFTGE